MLALCFYKDNWMLGLGIWPLWGFVEFPCSQFLWLFFFSPTLSPSWFWYSIIFSYIPDQEMLLFLILWNFCIFQNRMGEKGDKLLITVVVKKKWWTTSLADCNVSEKNMMWGFFRPPFLPDDSSRSTYFWALLAAIGFLSVSALPSLTFLFVYSGGRGGKWVQKNLLRVAVRWA